MLHERGVLFERSPFEGTLRALDFKSLLENVPELSTLEKIGCHVAGQDVPTSRRGREMNVQYKNLLTAYYRSIHVDP